MHENAGNFCQTIVCMYLVFSGKKRNGRLMMPQLAISLSHNLRILLFSKLVMNSDFTCLIKDSFILWIF